MVLVLPDWPGIGLKEANKSETFDFALREFYEKRGATAWADESVDFCDKFGGVKNAGLTPRRGCALLLHHNNGAAPGQARIGDRTWNAVTEGGLMRPTIGGSAPSSNVKMDGRALTRSGDAFFFCRNRRIATRGSGGDDSHRPSKRCARRCEI